MSNPEQHLQLPNYADSQDRETTSLRYFLDIHPNPHHKMMSKERTESIVKLKSTEYLETSKVPITTVMIRSFRFQFRHRDIVPGPKPNDTINPMPSNTSAATYDSAPSAEPQISASPTPASEAPDADPKSTEMDISGPRTYALFPNFPPPIKATSRNRDDYP
ncbi:hypothetical protein K505DRAFT_365915 [Melanomma pulvis-pyrius CBS 109.77]|uniref:Uncharacterized protein n=1 Tax=Melanomma pulvis-pyrius CBS 109.77 TaxID=1314802 RepID=A0A6A6WYU6_9PLEO|nr:hypothetical protein K505DRAFT_365915 [Melanomma pulvis-pyrius CBS 109.77]